MNLPLKIAFRYLFSSKSTNAINVISYISMVGMGIGALVLVVLLSVFNGFEDIVIELQSSFYADVELDKTQGKVFEIGSDELDQLAHVEGVEAYSLVLEENAYITLDGKSTVAKVRAFDENFEKVNGISEYMLKGGPELQLDGKEYALLGRGIYFILDASYTEPISIAIPKKGKSSAITAAQLFNVAQIMPGGVFGIQNEFDNSYILTSIDFLRKLQGFTNEVSSVEIKVAPGFNAEKVAENILTVLGTEYETTTRIQQNKSLYKAMQAEKYVMIAIMFLVLLIISFTIVGALSMLAMEKKLDISILKTMGADKPFIFKVFLLQGVLGSLIGATVGTIIGVVLVLLQELFGFVRLGTDGGFVIEAYPVQLELLDVFIAFVLITVISFIASWLPASRAANGDLQFVKY